MTLIAKALVLLLPLAVFWALGWIGYFIHVGKPPTRRRVILVLGPLTVAILLLLALLCYLILAS